MDNLWKPHRQECGFAENPTPLTNYRDRGTYMYLSKNMERKEE